MSQGPSETTAPKLRAAGRRLEPSATRATRTSRAAPALADIYSKFSAKAAAEARAGGHRRGGGRQDAARRRVRLQAPLGLRPDLVAGRRGRRGADARATRSSGSSSGSSSPKTRRPTTSATSSATCSNQRSRWLIVFDGAITPQQVQGFLPPKPIAGNVVITSRNPNWSDVGGIVPLRAAEARRVDRAAAQRTRRNDTERIRVEARAGAGRPAHRAEPGGGRHRQEPHQLSKQYLHRFEQLWAELLQKGIRLDEQPDAVAMSWELSIQQVECDHARGAGPLEPLRILRATADPPRVPLGLRAARDAAAAAARRSATRRCCTRPSARSRAYSMMDGDEHTIAVHPMVAAAARRRLETRRGAAAGSTRPCAASPGRSRSSPTTSPRGRARASCCRTRWRRRSSARGRTWRCSRLPSCSTPRRLPLPRRAARPARKDLLGPRDARIYERVSGVSSPKVAAVANNLGRVLTRLGEHAAAQDCFAPRWRSTRRSTASTTRTRRRSSTTTAWPCTRAATARAHVSSSSWRWRCTKTTTASSTPRRPAC